MGAVAMSTDDIRYKARAAKALADAQDTHEAEMDLLLAVFHPDMDDKRRRELRRDARERDRGLR